MSSVQFGGWYDLIEIHYVRRGRQGMVEEQGGSHDRLSLTLRQQLFINFPLITLQKKKNAVRYMYSEVNRSQPDMMMSHDNRKYNEIDLSPQLLFTIVCCYSILLI